MRISESVQVRSRSLHCVYLNHMIRCIDAGNVSESEAIEQTMLSMSRAIEEARQSAVDAEKRATPRRLG